MPITPLPTPPSRADDATTFASKADALLAALPTFVAEVNALGIDTAGENAVAAAASEAAAAASANFAGQWAGLVGALTIPATVEHADVVWLLLNNLADVTASEPGVTADWMVVTGVTTTQPVTDDSTKLASTAFVHDLVHGVLPAGVILLWSGAVAAIPTGWALCNGANGTPDLRGRFVIAAGGTYAVGATGSGTIPLHGHSFSATTSSDGTHTHVDPHWTTGGPTALSPLRTDSGSDPDVHTTESSGAHTHTVSGTSGNYGTGSAVIAIHYALAYIMKTT